MIRTTSNNPALSKKQFLTATTTMKLGEEADSGIVVDPVSIKFDSVQPGVLYVMTFSVRNVTKVAQRIRISPPKCGYFALNYIPAGPIAAGLDIRAEIECQIPANTKEVVFTDKVVISMGKSIFEIPIYACKPSATVKFDKTVDFGSIIQGQSNQKEIVFENVGSIKGSVKIIAPTNQNLKVTPTKFDLEPIGSTNSVGVVKLSFDAQQSGFFRELLKVSIVGTLEDQLIDISGQVIEQKLLLLTENNKGSLEIADFGNLFFGQTKTINAYLVNTGPLPLSFLINYDEEEDANVPSSRSEEEGPTDDPTSSYSKSLNISPMDGMIKPFSQIVLSITFNPVVNVPGRGFVKQYLVDNKNPKSIVRRATIECTDLDQSIMLTLQGSAVSPSVSVIPSMLRFGDCPVNDRRDILLSLENNNKFPTTFQFPKVANFKFEPSKGILSAMETKSIIASFSPPQLGKFKTTLKLSIADGLTVKELKMLGESTDVGQKKQLIGGTDKLPDDFRVSHKFVNSEEEAEARHEKRTLREMKEVELKKLLTAGKANTLEDMATAIDLTNDPMANLDALSSTSSAERDHIYGLTEKSLVKALPEDHPHIVRQQHNKLYNTFLQQSHLKRVETRRNQVQKKLTSRSSINPNDPDMGMDRGLEEPKLHIPKAGEPLWLATGTKDGESGGGVNRMPIDENRLIQKKYNSTPATQAEQRDCSVELSPDGLKLVQSSHKVCIFTIDY